MKKTKLLCLVLCLVFAFSIMLTACDDTTDTDTTTMATTAKVTTAATTAAATTAATTAAPVVLDKPDQIDITKTYYFGDSLDNSGQKAQYSEYMTETYGINFIYHYPARNNYTEVINLSVMSGDLVGIVQLFTPIQVKEWSVDGLIFPLNDYLEGNEVFENTFPEAWKETYTFDGELYALAQGNDGEASMFARSIRGDWLDALGMDVPTTVTELYDASYAFTYDDPDGDGIDNTFGMTSRSAWLMQDVFQAFDCRLNHVADAVPLWNPNTNVWEDSMLKTEMADCLNFCANAVSENVMDPEAFVVSSSVAKEKVKSGYYGGFFYWDSWILSVESAAKTVFPDAYMEGIYALKGNITENINQYGISQGGPMAMTVYTSQPEETINWYMDIHYGSAAGIFTGRLGVLGETVGTGMINLVGNKVYKNFYISQSTGKITGYSAPGVVGGHPDYRLGVYYEYVYNSGDPEYNATSTLKYNDGKARRAAWFDAALEWGGVYLLPESLKEPDSDIYLSIKGDLSSASSEAIAKTYIGEISVEEALASYRATAKALGAQEILDLANEALGVASNQYY